MKNEHRKQLLSSQQGELDAVVLYRKLAAKVKDKETKDKFLKISADEGKHAAILKGYTGVLLKPKNFKARLVIFLYTILGANKTYDIMRKGELKSIGLYENLASEFPRIKEIMNDEERHAEILAGCIK